MGSKLQRKLDLLRAKIVDEELSIEESASPIVREENQAIEEVVN